MAFTSALIDMGKTVAGNRAWQRVIVDEEVWRQAILGVAAGEADMLGLWCDDEAVHMALLGAADNGKASCRILVVSLTVPERSYPSVALTHPPALRLERSIRDLHGVEPIGLPDTRPWLDHGRWGVAQPLGHRAPAAVDGVHYAFHSAVGPPLHQIPVGPVHAGIIEPGHFRFSANGETVVRLEQRLGYVHKGIEGLLVDVPIERARRIAGRVSGDSTVAYAFAFAMAVEAALGVEVPARAQQLRAVMAELERLANHFGDVGAICNDASFSMMHAHCGAVRERILRACEACFGHRLMMDCVLPGGVAVDLGDDGPKCLHTLILEVRKIFPELIELYDNTASLQDRTAGTGVLTAKLASQYGAGGPIGRASGRGFDARASLGYAPYDDLAFAPALRREGDVDARIWVRFFEVEQSLSIIEQILHQLPQGTARVDLPDTTGIGKPTEGLALVEGFRGDVLAWVRIGGNGLVARCHLRDPSCFQWPLLEAAIEGNIVADFPLCNKSFNCSYSGHDL